MTYAVYDIETYPNVFTVAFKPTVPTDWTPSDYPGFVFEISEYRNDATAIVEYLRQCTRLIGFNNFYFDWPILNRLYENPSTTPYELYQIANDIINGDNRFKYAIWKPYIEQCDLYLIHHFDNPARRTSLKALEFNMRSANIEDLPFEPGRILTYEEIQTLKKYNLHDTVETEKFYYETRDMIRFREEIGPHALNYNDTKIGKKLFEKELEKSQPGITKNPDGSPRQTRRGPIPLKDIIFPYVQFQHDHNLKNNLNWLLNQTAKHTKDKDCNTCFTIGQDGFHVNIGLGGIHGSIERQRVYSDDEHTVLDVDVTSYYPSLAIENGMFPEHLGPMFVDIYRGLRTRRVQYPKGSTENASLKLALNGAYGDSNNQHSPLYDPKYMLTVTINGQLLLLMLAEQLLKHVPGLTMIQINTDGMTVRFPTRHREILDNLCSWWQNYTCLKLEDVEYSRMFIKDVNNYIAQSTDGKLKRKGKYAYDRTDQQELPWYKNHSFLVVPKAAEACFLHGTSLEDFIYNHDDVYDFLGRIKVRRSDRLQTRDGRQLQNITRYYSSISGDEFFKIMPPLAGKTNERVSGIEVGWLLNDCNNFDGQLINLNHDFYIEKASKLVF